jgi:hypothetical protein
VFDLQADLRTGWLLRQIIGIQVLKEPTGLWFLDLAGIPGLHLARARVLFRKLTAAANPLIDNDLAVTLGVIICQH